MAINFCNPAFGTSVSCSSVSADGYEPMNLLKPGAFGLWKGFLAEHFIKPPINISFTFPFEIDVCCIILDPNVGSQRSSGVEIFSAKLPQGESSGGNAMQTSSQNAMQTSSQTMSTDRTVSSVVSTNIGKGYCNNVSPRLIMFLNRMYKSRLGKHLPLAPLHVADAPDVLTRDFRTPNPSCVRSVNQIVVRITRVQGGSVLAMRRVEIWGQPATSCERPLFRKILETARQLQGLGKRQSGGSSRGQPEKSSARAPHSSSKPAENDTRKAENLTEEAASQSMEGSNSSVECPEEFLDPITCSMMVIPILLPSGHTIDQETLEKHQRIEATWGRPPNDPFTGVPFSQTSKPIPNVKLKVRIDKFLLTGGTAFQNVPRTAGRSDGHEANMQSGTTWRASVLVQPGETDLKKPSQSVLNGKGAVISCRKTDNKLNCLQGQKDHLAQGGHSKKRQYSEFHEVSEDITKHQGSASKKSRSSDDRDSSPSLSSPASNSKVGHEKMVSDSLEDALASTLASLPSYSRPGSAKPEILQGEAKAIDLCINCSSSTQDVGAKVIYSMPCGHFICRTCMTQMASEISCLRCKHIYKTSDISRVHSR